MDNVIPPPKEKTKTRKRSSASNEENCGENIGLAKDGEQSAMDVINEIFNPSLKIPETVGHYTVPKAVEAGDMEALNDLDERKLVELKEVFTLFDSDCDGYISKDDLRTTLMALGSDAEDDLIQLMLDEAITPLDYEAFVVLMSCRTIELDPEDVLLEAWSKWDLDGTGFIEEKRCLIQLETFPHLKEALVQTTTESEDTICNLNADTLAIGTSYTESIISGLVHIPTGSNHLNSRMFQINEQMSVYTSNRILGLRISFSPTVTSNSHKQKIFEINGTFQLLEKDKFKTDGYLIPDTYCSYKFLPRTSNYTNVEHNLRVTEKWQYIHSPRYPAKYPSHINCQYRFIGSSYHVVQVLFEDISIIPRKRSCIGELDKLIIYDSSTTNKSNIIDVICSDNDHRGPFISTGPNLLIEFEVSSNRTRNGFRAKYRFINHVFSKGLNSTGDRCGDDIQSTAYFKKGEIQPLSTLGQTVCRYDFHALPNESVQIIIFFPLNTVSINSKTNESNSCSDEDTIRILSPESGEFKVINTLCRCSKSKTVMSIGSQLRIEFNSMQGFRAKYKFVQNLLVTSGHQIENPECTYIYNSSIQLTGWFTSPNYPELYPRDVECNYYFIGAISETVVIKFTKFDVEGILPCEDSTASDYVEFSNFMTTDRKFQKMCGRMPNDIGVQSDGHFFRVTFRSNDRFDKNGFRAFYSFKAREQIEDNIHHYTDEQSSVYITNKGVALLLENIILQINIALSNLLIMKYLTL